jgi:leader peptidase (prepilin peptidase)/N-methyltransferase
MTITPPLEQPITPSRGRFLAVVAGAAIASAAVSVWADPGLRGASGAMLALVVLWIALVDARWQIIPNELNAAAFALGLLHAVIQNPHAASEAVAAAVLRAAILASLFLGLRWAYRCWRGREGIGLGDVKLAGVAGAWLDWTTIPIAIEIAALSALAVYGTQRYWFGRPLSPTSRLPFGLFFAPAIWLGWLLETTILNAPYRTALF